MLIKNIRSGIIMVSLFLLLCGCTVELRSPIVFKRSKEEEKASPAPKETVRTKREYPKAGTPAAEQPPTIVRREKGEEPEASKELSVAPYQKDTFSPEKVVILSEEYLANTPYKTLGNITVKDVSQNGFSKEEAKQALKFEAFRQFGSQAKGIMNVQYKGEASFFGTERFSEASGNVVTWEERVPAYERETEVSPQGHNETGIKKKERVTGEEPVIEVPPIPEKQMEEEREPGE